MLTWIVMWLNQAMFSPIGEYTKHLLQFMSYVELFIEVALLLGFFVFLIDRKSR